MTTTAALDLPVEAEPHHHDGRHADQRHGAAERGQRQQAALQEGLRSMAMATAKAGPQPVPSRSAPPEHGLHEITPSLGQVVRSTQISQGTPAAAPAAPPQPPAAARKHRHQRPNRAAGGQRQRTVRRPGARPSAGRIAGAGQHPPPWRWPSQNHRPGACSPGGNCPGRERRQGHDTSARPAPAASMGRRHAPAPEPPAERKARPSSSGCPQRQLLHQSHQAVSARPSTADISSADQICTGSGRR